LSPLSTPQSITTTAATVSTTDKDRKIDEATLKLPKSCSKSLHSVPLETAATIADYIIAMKSEVNLSDSYRRDLIEVLTKLSKFFDNNNDGKKTNKSFKDMTRNAIIDFLESYRKPEESDPLHKWIGTYNIYRMHLLRFFKWLYSPDIEPSKRSKPSVVDNIPKLKRKEISIYKPSDLWTPEDDLLFLKFCPSKREKCYHAISRDLSARPHEILKLKIRDVPFKNTAISQYADVTVNSGKTGTRSIPLINSIPYLKDYLDHEHPMPGNPNAPLICGTGRSLGRHLRPLRMVHIYREYKNNIFPKLLESPTILPEDKI